jgi:outer membrane protein assembly factor BamB
VVAGEWVFALTDDAKLLCVARSTGKVRWIAQFDQWRDAEDKKGPIFWTGPVLAGNRLIVGSTEGKLVSVNPADGSFAEFGDLDQPISLPPIVANNMLYVLDDSGRISAFR